MNEHDLTTLLERSGARLEPDVEALVAGGAGRGRTRLRRRRGLAAVTAVASIGVAGALLQPWLGADRDGPDPATPIATDTSRPSPSGPTDPSGPAGAQRSLATRAEVRTRLLDLLPPGRVSDVSVRADTSATGASGYDPGLAIWLRVDGGDVVISITDLTERAPGGGAAEFSPEEACVDPDGPPCRGLPDGSWVWPRFGMETWASPGPTGNSVDLFTSDGWQVAVAGYDSTGLVDDDFRQVSDDPVLSPAQVEAIATSDLWFA